MEMRKRRNTFGNRRNIFLPEEIIELILLHLPARSIRRFRRVCWSWLSLTSQVSFIRAHIHCQRQAKAAVLLQCLYPTFFDLHLVRRLSLSRTSSVTENGQHVYVKMEGSCDGMLCFSTYQPNTGYTSFCLNNPLTGEWTSLPGMDFTVPDIEEIYMFCGFYFHPSTGEYKLLRYYDNPLNSGYEVYTIGKGIWDSVGFSIHNFSDEKGILQHLGDRSHDLHEDVLLEADHPAYPLLFHTLNRSFRRPEKLPILANGSLHWVLRCNGNCSHPVGGTFLLAFDIETTEFRNITLPKGGGRFVWRKTALVEMEMGLGLCSERSGMEMDIWFLEDYAKEVWVKRHVVNFGPIFSQRESFIRLAVTENQELVFLYNGYMLIHDIRRKTFTPLSLYNRSEGENCNMLVLHRESLGWYDTFKNRA